jgi:hypothetical protein
MMGPDVFKALEQQAEQQPVTDRAQYHWQRQTIAATFERIRRDPDHPWVAIGDFLDDWRFTQREDRPELVQEGIAPVGDTLDLRRWAAFCAAMVEWLCWQNDLPFPAWTSNDDYRLADPWFLYPGDLLRAWQLASTPAPFKMRNIFGGDQMLARVWWKLTLE